MKSGENVGDFKSSGSNTIWNQRYKTFYDAIWTFVELINISIENYNSIIFRGSSQGEACAN